ncbi:MAG TPA: nitroreductase/quinone reductase family protein [Myxococcota bacterium]|nr:nitroreductase/quinone reductase family protein [Myxococcota bacterium]
MKHPLRLVLIVLVAYVGIVAAFESMIGLLQPTTGDTLVITTSDREGVSNDRVLARLESEGQLYVAANHWPRAWYRQALENPAVEVRLDGERRRYRAVPATAEESERVHRENDPGLVFRILTGFPPREFLRLEPRP